MRNSHASGRKIHYSLEAEQLLFASLPACLAVDSFRAIPPYVCSSSPLHFTSRHLWSSHRCRDLLLFLDVFGCCLLPFTCIPSLQVIVLHHPVSSSSRRFCLLHLIVTVALQFLFVYLFPTLHLWSYINCTFHERTLHAGLYIMFQLFFAYMFRCKCRQLKCRV